MLGKEKGFKNIVAARSVWQTALLIELRWYLTFVKGLAKKASELERYSAYGRVEEVRAMLRGTRARSLPRVSVVCLTSLNMRCALMKAPYQCEGTEAGSSVRERRKWRKNVGMKRLSRL